MERVNSNNSELLVYIAVTFSQKIKGGGGCDQVQEDIGLITSRREGNSLHHLHSPPSIENLPD